MEEVTAKACVILGSALPSAMLPRVLFYFGVLDLGELLQVFLEMQSDAALSWR